MLRSSPQLTIDIATEWSAQQVQQCHLQHLQQQLPLRKILLLLSSHSELDMALTFIGLWKAESS